MRVSRSTSPRVTASVDDRHAATTSATGHGKPNSATATSPMPPIVSSVPGPSVNAGTL
jgi:hypothetical protein